MANISHLPMPEGAKAKEMLSGCSIRPFEDVIVIGRYDDSTCQQFNSVTSLVVSGGL